MFNPSRLTLARKRRGKTKTALARASQLTVRSISAFEAGDLLPSEETIALLSRVLHFPVSFFSGDDIEVPSIDGASFRALASMTASQRDMALAAGTLAIELSQWIDARFQLPLPNIPNMRGFEPEAAAQALRTHWSLGERPIHNVVHLLEAHGVGVFSLPRDSESVNAFSVWHRERPYVFLTTDKSGERGRFDGAHELGHLAMHRQGGPRSREAEIEADRFASAFLMPRASVLALAPRAPTLTILMQLKRKWMVSLAALAHRLRDLNMLTEWQYRTICIHISQRGFRTKEPEGIQREASQVLAKVFDSLRMEGVRRSAVARELCIEPADLDALIFGLIVTSVPGGAASSANGRSTSRANLRLV